MATAEAQKKKKDSLTDEVNSILQRADDIMRTQRKGFTPEVLEHYAQTANEKRTGEAMQILKEVTPERQKKAGGEGAARQMKEPEMRAPITKEGALETMAFVKAIEAAGEKAADLKIRKWTTTAAKTEVG